MKIYNEIKKELSLNDAQVAEMFGYKSHLSFANSSAKPRITQGIENIFNTIKSKEINLIYKKLKNLVIKNDFFVSLDSNETAILINKHIECFLFQFTLTYSKSYKDYIGSTYLQPEECTTVFSLGEISDLYIYGIKNEFLELEEAQYEKLEKLIYKKLIIENQNS